MPELKKLTPGWLPDLPDVRDFLWNPSLSSSSAPLRPVVDMRSKCPPIEDQLNIGSCTSQALVGNIEFLQLKAGKPLLNLSRLFVYYNERLLENDVRRDSGAMLRDGIKTLVQYGVCPESTWPYKVRAFAHKPTKNAYTRARDRRIAAYFRLGTLEQMLRCLSDGFPFVFGFTVYESFESREVQQSGILSIPGMDEKAIGGHAVMAVGYNIDKKIFIIRNSWGTSWGMDGYFTMPFRYVELLADDFWTIQL